MMVRNYKRKTEDKWSKEDLVRALTLISEKKMKINDAARSFGISRATLYRHNRKVIDGDESLDNVFTHKGGWSILTELEENVLEKTVLDLRDQGFSVSSNDIKKICFEYCDTNDIPNRFNKDRRLASDDWYYGFLKRHPVLTGTPSSEDEFSEDTAQTDSPDSIKQAKSRKHVSWKRIKIKRKKKMSDDNKPGPSTGPKRRKRTTDAASGTQQAVNGGNEFKVEAKEEPADYTNTTDFTDNTTSMSEEDLQTQDSQIEPAEGGEQHNCEQSEEAEAGPCAEQELIPKLEVLAEMDKK